MAGGAACGNCDRRSISERAGRRASREPTGRGAAWIVFVPPNPPQGRRRSDEGPPSQAARQAGRRLEGGPAAGGGYTVKAAVLRYRVMAYITGVVLMILCFVGIPLQVAGHPAVANDVGVVHGILYIIYLVFAWQLSRRLRLATKPTVIMLLAGTVPVMTFIVERWITHRFIDPALAGQAQPAVSV